MAVCQSFLCTVVEVSRCWSVFRVVAQWTDEGCSPQNSLCTNALRYMVRVLTHRPWQPMGTPAS